MARAELKKIWDSCPPFVRSWLCSGICKLYGRSRDLANTPLKTEPYYICGAFSNTSGLGQGARVYADELERAGKKVTRVDVTRQMRVSSNYHAPKIACTATNHIKEKGCGTVVIHANPPHFYFVLASLGKEFLQNKHVIGYWAWEKEYLPAYWLPAFNYVDSIEVPSAFIAGALSCYTDKAVSLHPHFFSKPGKRKINFAQDGKIHCLYIFDAGSSFERKNPIAVLEAFQKAFSSKEATLTFKASNAEAFPAQYELFEKACIKASGVNIITAILDERELEKLYLEHDIYISLHRSEGYGLTIKEAIEHGLYVVATGYGGNTDFMNVENAFSVKPKYFWNGYAEPNIDEAATILCNIGKKLLNKTG